MQHRYFSASPLFSDDEAQLLGEAMGHIEQLQGLVTPDRLVAYAWPSGSPIHSLWEWRDDVAAKEYRREQARGYIQHVRIVGQEVGVVPAEARVVVKDTPKRRRVVEETDYVDYETRTLRKAQYDLTALKKRLEKMGDCALVVAAIEVALQELVNLAVVAN